MRQALSVPPDVWYNSYDGLRQRVGELRGKFLERCSKLAVDPNKVLGEFTREILIRAVHESNWQEGLELDDGKTRELADAAFDELEDIVGPHLDMNKVLRFHRNAVLRLKRDGATVEEIATYNLSRAHHAIAWIGTELSNRQAASLAKALLSFQKVYDSVRERLDLEARSKIERGFAIVEDLEAAEQPPAYPTTAPAASEGQLTKELLRLDSAHLLSPMRITYVHFLHKLVLMGIVPLRKCGRFRTVPVHVGNPDIYFPVPSAVPQIMDEFCRKFPTILPTTVTYDPVLVAARVSYNLVSIHPYEDGNGRVSRLLMNLVLWGHFPPVYLKADGKGRHRYGQALHRADRGNVKPLAALIAMSLVEIFERLLRSLQISGDR